MWVNFDELPLQSGLCTISFFELLTRLPASSHVLFHNCFVVIAADEQKQAASGCSIDSFTKLFKAFGAQYNLTFFDRFSIAHKSNDEVLISNLDDFKQLIHDGHITQDTLVFNNLIDRRQDLFTKWELPLKESWQKRYL